MTGRATGTSNGVGREGSFPAKVFPPDPSKNMILLHGTYSDINAVTLTRNDVRRAGLVWPYDQHDTQIKTQSRKDEPMTDSAPTTAERKHGTHLMEPAGARSMKYAPSQSSIDRFIPATKVLSDTFWTDEVLAQLNGAGVKGYAASSGMQRVQGMLDHLGYRVIETRRNRNGYAYRWALEAEPRPAAEARVTPIGKPETEPVPIVDFGEAKADELDAPSVLSANAGPVAAAMAEAQRRSEERRTKHERVQCETCQRWFTRDGYEHHIEATQHGENKPVLTTTAPFSGEAAAAIEALAADPQQRPEPAAEPAAEPLQPETTTMVSRADFEAMEALATEAQEVITETRSQLFDANEEADRLREQAATARAELTEALGQLETAVTARATIMATLDDEREARNRRAIEHREEIETLEHTISLLEESSNVGTWLIDPEENRTRDLVDLFGDAARLGVKIELRARRA